MNPSQDPAQPQPFSPPPVDPTAEPGTYAGPAHPGPATPGGPDTGAGPSQPGAYAGPSQPYAGPSQPGAYAGPADPGGQSAYAGPGYPGGPDAYAGQFGLAHSSGPGVDESDGYAGLRGPFGFRQAARRPWKRTLIVAVSLVLAIMVLGGPLGLLWRWIAPSVPVIDVGQGGIVVNDPSPEEYIAADGWFTLLGLGFGLLVAVAAWLILRRDRGPFLLAAVVTGTLGAGYLVAPRVGEMIGRSSYQHWQETATQGATYAAPPEVHSLGPMLVPAFIAAIALTLLAGWSNDPDLDAPGAKPGYGPNADPADGYPGYFHQPGTQTPPGPYSTPGGPGQPSAYGQPGPYSQPGTHDQPGAYGQPGSQGQPGGSGQPGS